MRSRRTPRRVAYMANELFACAWYRCVVPGVALMKRGDDVELNDALDRIVANPPDVFVIQAMLRPDVLEFTRQLVRAGRIAIFDLDDEPFSVPPENPASEYWMRPETQTILAEMMRTVSAVTTTTPELAERFRRFSSNIHVLPNMLPADMWPAERKVIQEKPELVIGWAGGLSHALDLRVVEDALHQILDRYEHVTVELVGGQPQWLSRTHPRLKFVQAVSIQEYPGILSNFDIAIAPLAENRFNQGKSDLKPLEYSMIGLPVVASALPSYARSIRHGETGLVARSHKDWLRHLKTLIEDIELRDRMGSAARSWAETRTIDRHIGLWERVYGFQD